jgi:hypothetical protein
MNARERPGEFPAELIGCRGQLSDAACKDQSQEHDNRASQFFHSFLLAYGEQILTFSHDAISTTTSLPSDNFANTRLTRTRKKITFN